MLPVLTGTGEAPAASRRKNDDEGLYIACPNGGRAGSTKSFLRALHPAVCNLG